VRDQLWQVGSLERVATGEDDEWSRWPERGEVIQQPFALVRRQLEGVARADRIRPAVGAHELAGPRDLPDDDEGPLCCGVAHEPHRPGRCNSATGAGLPDRDPTSIEPDEISGFQGGSSCWVISRARGPGAGTGGSCGRDCGGGAWP